MLLSDILFDNQNLRVPKHLVGVLGFMKQTFGTIDPECLNVF